MPDRDTLARVLLDRSARLTPGPGSTRQTLEALRFAIARSLSQETNLQEAPQVTEEQLAAAHAYFDAEAAKPALSALGLEGDFTLERTDPLQFLTDPQHSALQGLKKASSVGPFLDADGREIWFNIYGTASGRTVYVPGVVRPVLVMTSARLPDVALARFRLTLDPGTVWVLARLLDPAAPEDGYVGFAVTSGSVGLPAVPNIAGDRLTLPVPGTIELSLTLAAPPPAPANAACAFGSLTAPAEITITLSLPPTFTGIRGNLVLGASTLDIAAGAGITFHNTWNMIAFRGRPQPEWLDLADIAHAIAQFSGEVEIERAAWAVPVTRPADPNALGEADPASSGWLLHVGAGGFVSWPESNVGPVRLDNLSLLATPARLLVRATSNDPLAAEAKHQFGLWSLKHSGQPLPVTVHTVVPLEIVFLCDAQAGEALSLTAQASLALDRPLSAVGNTLPALDAPVHLIFSEKDALRKVTLLARGLPAASAAAPWPLVLENGFFHVRSPKLVLLTGALQDGGALREGRVSVHLDVHGFLPTLPDPYVANLQAHGEFGRGGASGALIATIDWSANEAPRLSFRGSPGTGGLALVDASQPGSRPARGATQPEPWSNTDRSKALAKARREREADLPQVLEQARATDARNLEVLGRRATEAGITFVAGMRLLDVSTNRHQVGVQIRGGGRGVSANTAALTVEGLHVTTSLAGVQVFMLPQVQWEPVTTLDRDQDLEKFLYFPTPLASANDGGATLIGSRSLKLAPVIPDLALDRFMETFSAGERLGVVTTLPFGIRAVMALRPGPGGDTLALNNASYSGPLPLQNALQLSARPLGGISVPGNESPSFEGAAAQLINGVNLVTGAPEGISVLGSHKDGPASVEGMFNNEFAIARPRVPLTRLDLSGYGASTFSDWANPYATFAEAGKVHFNVLVGRTALEIVKFNSVLYPWGIRVTRMVTVERTRNAGVVRRATGWQPESNGIFDFRYKDKSGTAHDSPFVVHPGVFRGLFAIRNIRPAPGATAVAFSSSKGDAKVLAYHFDCEAIIESARGEVRVPANGMTGFLHILPVGEPLAAQDLAALLAQESAVGGPVDAEILVGDSGLRVRALRIEVDTAGSGGVPEFAAAVRCSPIFAPNGAWSVVRQAGPAGGVVTKDAEPVPDGAPLIREGSIKYVVGAPVPDGRMLRPASPGAYRFADAQDLLAGPSPKRDYGFLQTVPTHAFLFRRPQIAANDTRITSNLTPLFADIYALGTTESLFPPIENAIELHKGPYVLAMNPATGRFRLDPPVSLPKPRGDLILGDGVEKTMKLVYTDTHLSLTIDEDAWSMDMPALVAWNGFPDLPELIGTRSRLSGSSTSRSMISEVDTLMTPWVETLLTFIPGMNPRQRPPDIELAATNTAGADKFEAKFFKKFKLSPAFELKGYGEFFSGREDPANGGLGPPVSYYGVLLGFEFEGKIPIPPFFYLILGLEFEVGTKVTKSGFQKKSKLFLEIKAYVGFGVGTEGPGYELLGYIGGGLVIEYDKHGWHFGGLGLIKAEMNIIEIVTMSIAGEFTGIGRREGDHTVTEYEGVIQVNVTFCFLSLEVSWDLEFEKSV